MTSSSQRRAIETHRRRLAERGLGRFEVRGLEEDKELIRRLARLLAVNDEAAGVLRNDLTHRFSVSEPPRAGGVLMALRRSPLVGADLDLTRAKTPGRDPGL